MTQHLAGTDNIRAFTFLTQTSIIVASLVPPDLSQRHNSAEEQYTQNKVHTCLIVYDLAQTRSGSTKLSDVPFTAVLRLFDLDTILEGVELEIYSDPSPGSYGQLGPEVPFCIPPEDRLLILDIGVPFDRPAQKKTFAVTYEDLSRNIDRCLSDTSLNKVLPFDWALSCLVPIPSRRNGSPWVCSSYGLRYAQPRAKLANDSLRLYLLVEDYHALRSRRTIMEASTSFEDDRAQISVTQVQLPKELLKTGQALEIMIGEDNIIALEASLLGYVHIVGIYTDGACSVGMMKAVRCIFLRFEARKNPWMLLLYKLWMFCYI
jgi:hypothetical protein